jgi:organic hydroperoxide reductase OsmC/OhrA
MRKFLRFSAILCGVACVTAALAAPKANPKVGASSVWTLPEQFMAAAHAACDKSAPSGFAECVIDQMAKAGASADAVSFARALYKQNGGDVGIMTGFRLSAL